MASQSLKRFSRLSPANTVFFECDIQVKIAKHQFNHQAMIMNAIRMTQVSEILSVPIIATTHKNFGCVVPEITSVANSQRQTFPNKTSFTMLTDDVQKALSSMEKTNVVIYGCETHICVKQTCLDLLERNYNVHLVVDGITSMKEADRNINLQSLRDAGAQFSTFQSVVFDLIRDANHPDFCKLLPIIKDVPECALDLASSPSKL